MRCRKSREPDAPGPTGGRGGGFSRTQRAVRPQASTHIIGLGDADKMLRSTAGKASYRRCTLWSTWREHGARGARGYKVTSCCAVPLCCACAALRTGARHCAVAPGCALVDSGSEELLRQPDMVCAGS